MGPINLRVRYRPIRLGWCVKQGDLEEVRKSDLKIIADEQGHGMRTHLEDYVQSHVKERKAEAAKLHADFLRVFRNRG